MSQQRDGDQHNMYTEWPKSLGVPQVRQSAGSNMKSHDGSNRRASIQHVLQNFPKSALVPETASLSTRLPSTRAILTLSSEAILKQQQLQAKIIRKKLPTPLELQKEPSPKCSFQVRCRFGIATRKCHNCIKFDPVRAGFYCEACFEARHPAYRMNHSWILLDENATAINQEKEWITHLATHQLEQDQAELKLLLNETQTFLHENTNLTEKTRRLLPGSQKNNFDFAKAFESIQLIDTTLKELIKQVHVQLSTKPLTKLDAIKKIQSMWKIRQARKQLKLLIRSIYTEFKDPATGKIFYFNKQTKTSQWTKPKALGQEPILKPQSTTTKLNKNKKLLLMIEDKPRQQQMAAQMIQGMFRIFIARKHLHHIAFKVYEKIWDPISQRFYYHNTKTKQVTWVCPVFLMDDNTYNIKKNKTPLTKEEAAIILQRMFRKRNSFLVLLRMCRLVYERIYDPEQKTFYYHNTRTHETSWEKPKILKQEEVFTPRTRRRQIAEQQKQQQVVIEKKKKEWTPEQAAICLQGIFRLRKAKNVLADKILQVYRKVHDPLTGQFYYYNTKTGGVSWECSSFVAQTKVDIEVYPST